MIAGLSDIDSVVDYEHEVFEQVLLEDFCFVDEVLNDAAEKRPRGASAGRLRKFRRLRTQPGSQIQHHASQADDKRGEPQALHP